MIHVVGDIKLTKNFMLSEFVCHDGSNEVMLDAEFVTKMQALRDFLGCAVTVVSAYRTIPYNQKIGGAPKSQHLLGKAGDLKVLGKTPLEVAIAAERVGFRGIGVYTHNGQYFTHVDVRPTKSYWRDNADTKNLTSVKTLAEIKI